MFRYGSQYVYTANVPPATSARCTLKYFSLKRLHHANSTKHVSTKKITQQKWIFDVFIHEYFWLDSVFERNARYKHGGNFQDTIYISNDTIGFKCDVSIRAARFGHVPSFAHNLVGTSIFISIFKALSKHLYLKRTYFANYCYSCQIFEPRSRVKQEFIWICILLTLFIGRVSIEFFLDNFIGIIYSSIRKAFIKYTN